MIKNKKAVSDGAVGFMLMLFVVAVVFAVIALFAGFDTVEPSHKGVMVSLGELKGTMNPGMAWTGIFTTTYQYDLKLRKSTIVMDAANSAVDKDGQSVYAKIEINYRLNGENVEEAFVNVGYDEDLANTLNIQGIIMEGFKTTTSHYTSLEIMSNRDVVKAEAIKIIKENFPEKYFILENVVISNIDLNPSFKAAIEQKKTNEELAKAKTAEVEIAKAQADKNIADARGRAESAKLAAEAEAYKIEVRAKAEALALELKAQELTPLMVQQTWIDAWASGGAQVPQYVLGGDTEMLMTMPGMKLGE